VFLLGLLYELFGAVWVKACAAGDAGRAGVTAALCASCNVAGILLAASNIHNAPGLILGYGVGAYLGVKISQDR
jgi:2-methylcitrate dehydratase PrpD